VGLLDTGDDRVKRLTANDIIDHFLKHKELKDLPQEKLVALRQCVEKTFIDTPA
jgi:hypothetical protein